MKFLVDILLIVICLAILVTNYHVYQQNKVLADYNEQLRNDNASLLDAYDKLLKVMHVEENY